ARDKALEASNLKSAFVANISHELRTPLAGILGMNEILLTTELDEEQREIAMIVQESAHALLGIVNDILDISRIESDKLTIDNVPLSIRFVINDALHLLNAAAMKKNITLVSAIDADVPEVVYGDPDRIRQVLLNLIGNAIKFTNRGHVKTTVTLDSQ